MAAERGKLFDAAASSGQIRDTIAHNSGPLDWATVADGMYLFVAENDLDQAVSLQFQGSQDGSTWHNLQSAIAVAAGAKNPQTLTDPWTKVRCVATCSVAPASGGLTVHWTWRKNV